MFYSSPEVSWNTWLKKALFTDGELTAMGEMLANAIPMGTWIDVPCGLEQVDGEPRVLDIVAQFGVQHFIEVDADVATLANRLQQTPRTHGMTSVETIQSDIVEFLEQWERVGEGVQILYISGLQPLEAITKDEGRVQAELVPYLLKLYDACTNASTPGDLLIINDPTSLVSGIDTITHLAVDPHVALLQRGWDIVSHDTFGKVVVWKMLES